MPSVIDIQAADWIKEVDNSEDPVVVEFWHHRCAGCQQMKPIYEKLPSHIEGVKFTRMNLLDSKENRAFAIDLGVRSTPTFIILCDGTPVGIIIGVRTMEEIKAEIMNIVSLADSCLMQTPLE